jgi:hypothetical protein
LALSGILLFVIGALPTIIVAFRRHPDWKPIVAVNWLLGWTILGWVVALVWSLRPIKTATPVPEPAQSSLAWWETKTCPSCADQIEKSASVCRHCNATVSGTT